MNMPSIVVSTVKPENYVHSGAFDEVYETVSIGLQNLGFRIERVENSVSTTIPTILFGAHLLDADTLRNLPEQTILYNLEQVDDAASWLSGPLPSAMTHHEVWDFSDLNLRRLSAMRKFPHLVYAPVGYVPQLTRIPHVEEDIDVLFYGSLNERRHVLVSALKASGMNVVHAFGIYGEERDRLIARSKVVLNVHFYENGILEWVRIFYLLANGKAVLSENSILTAFDSGIENVVRFSAYNQLIQMCLQMVNNKHMREELTSHIPAYLNSRREETILASVLKASLLKKHANLG